jgi:LysR family transcriptional regulator (chromosome initiation inhibitor)
MLDYSAIAALAAVIETQSFQMAAGRLFVTQSAVSQRIKSLEQFYGEPVLVRALPYRPTDLGLSLLGHYKRVMMLEDALHADLKTTAAVPSLSISISRDTLETWFPKVIQQLHKVMPLKLEILADDQDRTLLNLQKGLVSACASTTSKPLPGCKSEFIGFFDYALVATPEFKKTYFSNKNVTKADLLSAPTLLFDQHDNLHAAYLKHYFDIDDMQLTHSHVIPSVHGFKQFALQGYAYVLIPYLDILQEIKNKQLVQIVPDKMWKMPVYWHSFELETEGSRAFNNLVIATAKELLRQ